MSFLISPCQTDRRRILQTPDNLSAQIVKAVYFPSRTMLEAQLDSHPYQIWREIIEGHDVLCQGLIRRTWNGSSTNIWNRNWLPRDELMRPLLSLIPNPPQMAWAISLTLLRRAGIAICCSRFSSDQMLASSSTFHYVPVCKRISGLGTSNRTTVFRFVLLTACWWLPRGAERHGWMNVRDHLILTPRNLISGSSGKWRSQRRCTCFCGI